MRIKYPALAQPGGVITIIILKAIIFNIQKIIGKRRTIRNFTLKHRMDCTVKQV